MGAPPLPPVPSPPGEPGGEVPMIPGAEPAAPVFKIDVTDLAPPDKRLDLPLTTFEDYQRTYYQFFKGLGVPAWLNHGLSGLLAGLATVPAFLFKVLAIVIPAAGIPLAEQVLAGMDEIRKAADPGIPLLASLALNELLGTDFTPPTVPFGTDVAAHIARAQQVGALLHNQLLAEFSGANEITPESGRRAAQRFSGLNINFGLATGLLGVLGEMISFGVFGEWREMGVQVARNLGLGRLHRLAMRPLIEVMIATPYHWWLNQKFHPTLLTVGEVSNPFAQTVLPPELIFHDLELAGYTKEKIAALIKLHQKKLTDADVEILVRWGSWTRQQGIDYIQTLGFPPEIAETLFNVIELRRADARVRDLVSVLEGRVAEGHLSVPEFEAVLDKLPLADAEKSVISTVASYKQRSTHAQLTLAEMQTAFENALVDLGEFTDYLTRRGFDLDSQAILVQLTLLKTAQLADARKAKEARQEKAAARAAALAARVKKPPAGSTSAGP